MNTEVLFKKTKQPNKYIIRTNVKKIQSTNVKSKKRINNNNCDNDIIPDNQNNNCDNNDLIPNTQNNVIDNDSHIISNFTNMNLQK